jgi:tripartite-type tricarboxylate transporter receptor subunit TctC
VGSPARNALLPEVPAVAESIPGFSSVLWYAMAAPPKTPPEVVSKLAGAIREQMRQPAVAKILNELSMEVAPTTPAEARAFMAQEAQRWGAVVKEAKVTVDQ